MQAIRVHQTGGPEALSYETVDTPEPGPNTVRVKVEAAGLNFIDVYQRSGLYNMNLPFTPGVEAGGSVEAVGDGVTLVGVGDRVAYTMTPGAYADYSIVPQERLVKLPASIDAKVGAAMLLQGLTAQYLTRSTFPLQPGHKTLIHAAAGGVGLLLVQMAKQLGAYIIGTVSTEEKAQLAKEAGADEIILYTEADFEAETKRLTDGEGVDVAFDSVGQTTFEGSLNCLKPRGYLVLYGQSSGPVPPFEIQRLMSGGSLFLTRPSLGHYLLTREELESRSNDLIEMVASGAVNVHIDRSFPLKDAGEAHSYLEARKSKGKVLLIP